MGRRPEVLHLLPEEREYLELQTRIRTIQAQIMQRAKILILKADGYSVDHIAAKLDLNRKSVLLCIHKYKAGGVENALLDAPGRGRNAEITEEEKQWIISIALREPASFGYEIKTWSYARLAQHIQEEAEKAGYLRLSTIHKSTVNVILDAAGIKPYRLTYDEYGNAVRN